jgi:hypothetical protein
MKFNIKELTFIGLMSILMFLLCFLLGNTLGLITGISVAPGFINMFIQGIILVICVLTIKKFWTATILFMIYGILAIPTTMVSGLPGLYKILIGFIVGIIFDICAYIFKYKIKGLYIGILVIAPIETILIIFLYLKLNIPGRDILIKYWPIIVLLLIIITWLGILVGYKIYNKIKNKRAIRLIQK